MAILTNESAIEYVTTLCTEWGMDISITNAANSAEYGDEVIDVEFTYSYEGEPRSGCMSVWLETDGRLYGEW